MTAMSVVLLSPWSTQTTTKSKDQNETGINEKDNSRLLNIFKTNSITSDQPKQQLNQKIKLKQALMRKIILDYLIFSKKKSITSAQL